MSSVVLPIDLLSARCYSLQWSRIVPKNFNCRRHNEDGSYTYGYEGSDGSFKLETRFPDGRVQGRYGYVDIDTGKLKVIEYGADAMGFQVLDISSKQVTFLGNISLNKRELLGSKFTQFS